MKGFGVVDDILTKNCDVIYDYTTSESGLLGQTFYYKKILGFEVNVSHDSNYDYARIFFYTNTFDTYNATDAQKTHTIAHELGHSVKLAHPTSVQTAVMNQGLLSLTVTDYDKSELKRKWGN
jgi:Zn-dependent peptidase ImmA (M78 family)